MNMIFLVNLLILVTKTCGVTKLIIDTDMDLDVDDVGALCAAHALADLGEAEILAVVHNVGYPPAIGAVSVINHYYGRDDIALGAFKGTFGQNIHGIYVDDLVDNFESPVKHYDQVEDALTVLRKTLAASEDHSVSVVSLGFLTNLAALLSSPADSLSPLTGLQLLEQKVSSVWVMGGIYPQSVLFSEFNFNCGEGLLGDMAECEGSAKATVEKMPSSVKMIFSGFEVGNKVMSGGALTSCSDSANPCRQAYIDYCGNGVNRPSWDPLTLIAAVRGAEGVSCEETGEDGVNMVEMSGHNAWLDDTSRPANMTYFLLKDSVAVGNLIDELLCM